MNRNYVWNDIFDGPNVNDFDYAAVFVVGQVFFGIVNYSLSLTFLMSQHGDFWLYNT